MASIGILGGGIGGQVAAARLGAALRGSHRVVLFDRQEAFTFSPSLLWIMTGARRPAQIRRPLARLARHGADIVHDEVTAIDPRDRRVAAAGGEHRFDALLIALGAELAPDAVPGFQEAALNLYDLEGALAIRQALDRFRGGRVVVLVSSTPFKCPAAPYEAAFLIRDVLRRRGLPGQVEVFTPEPFPMPTAGPAVGAALRTMLESAGIGFHPDSKVIRIDPGSRRIAFANGATTESDLLIGIPSHRPPKAVRESGLAGPAGWIPVDPKTMATSYDNVYAIGDVAAVPIAGGKLLPKAGVFAHAQAEIVTRNILARLRGRTPAAAFDGRGWCAIEVGGGRAGFGSGNFYAEPAPQVGLHAPSVLWHWGKIAFEKWWLWRWF